MLDEVRAASLDDGTVTYLTSGNAPGTLARQVRTLAGQGELTGLKVFTSRDETLCLNVFNFDTAAPDSCFEAEEALAPHLEYARAKGGEGFWSEARAGCRRPAPTNSARGRRTGRASAVRTRGGDGAVAARVDANNGSAGRLWREPLPARSYMDCDWSCAPRT